MDKKKFEFHQPGQIRTRFAPSPTGFLHPGGARTALFNFLFAKKNKGKFILRIDDTDKKRSKKEFENDILEMLSWLKIEWDEGPDRKGPFEPYYQSQRIEIYEKYLKKLIEEKKAYFCFCSSEEIKAQKEYFFSIGKPPVYSGKCRNLSDTEVEKLKKEKKKFVIRLKVFPEKIKFYDLIKGELEFDTSLIGDFIIAKGLKEPLYNFASVIDDYEMKISHIIRGEEHLSNTPKQILIAKALGFSLPITAHLPLILNEDRSKLSKRTGSLPLNEYKKMGYLPEAIINFLAFLGWNPGTEKEIYSLDQLINDFSIERVKTSPAIFYQKRLDFLNGFYIRQKDINTLTEMTLPFFIEENFFQPIFQTSQIIQGVTAMDYKLSFLNSETKEKIDFETIQKIISLYQTRVTKLSDFPRMTDFFFKKEISLSFDLLKWKDISLSQMEKLFSKIKNVLIKIPEENWQKDYLFNVLIKTADDFSLEIKKEKDRGYLFWPLRVALTGKKSSAPPAEIMEILGKEKTLSRIEKTIDFIKKRSF